MMNKIFSIDYLLSLKTFGLGIYFSNEKGMPFTIIMSVAFLSLFFDFGSYDKDLMCDENCDCNKKSE